MRLHIKFLNIATTAILALVALAGVSGAQSLRRPVDSAIEPEPSLGALAAQVNPGLARASSPRVYTNADLKMRPTPVAPVTPPFPEIAAPTGILEHWAEPEIEPAVPDVTPEQYGVPIWDGGIFPFFSPGQGRGSHRPTRNFQGAPDPFTPFRRPNIVHFSGNGDFSAPATPSATFGIGGRGGRSHSGTQGSHSGQGGHGSGHGSKGK